MQTQLFFGEVPKDFCLIIDKTLTSSFNLVDSIKNVITITTGERPFQRYQNTIEKILTKNEMNELLVEVIEKIPDRKMELKDLEMLFSSFIKLTEKEEFQVFIKNIFRNEVDFILFSEDFINLASENATKELFFWNKSLLASYNTFENLQITNEVIQTLNAIKLVNAELESHKDPVWISKAFYHVLLKQVRFAQITRLYYNKKFRPLVEIQEYLGRERYDMLFDLHILG